MYASAIIHEKVLGNPSSWKFNPILYEFYSKSFTVLSFNFSV